MHVEQRGAGARGARARPGSRFFASGLAVVLALALAAGAAGEPSGVVVVDDQVVLSLHAGVGTITPAERAAIVNSRIERILSEPAIQPQELEARPLPSGEIMLVVGQAPVLGITAGDAVAAGLPQERLAGDWARRLREALIEAKPLHRAHEAHKKRSIKVPRQLQEISGTLNATHERLYRVLQREPTVADMAAAYHVTEEVLLEAMEARHAYQPLGLDQRHELGDGTESLALEERIGGGDAQLESLVENAALEAAVATLDARKQRILRLRFFGGCSQQEVAALLGLSQMHISRLERSALSQLRTAMVPTGLPGESDSGE